LDRSSSVPVPLHFVTLLECARFLNRLCKTTCASLEENRGISHHIVSMFEEEFNNVIRLVVPGNSGKFLKVEPTWKKANSLDLDYFTLLSTLLDVQAYYFMPTPDYSPEILRGNILKAYNTSVNLVRHALKLHEDMAFLSHAPHFVCRSLLSASCITLSVVLSPYMQDQPLEEKDSIMEAAITAMRTCSVTGEDLPSRASNMIEKFWSLNRTRPPLDVPMKDVAEFSHRLGTSLAFDCLRRWKKDIEKNKREASGGVDATGNANRSRPLGAGRSWDRSYFMTLGPRSGELLLPRC